jgi:hypothetical protein
VAVGAAIVAGALLIRKYWEPISAFFSGVIEGIMSAFAPVGEMFAPLAPIFDGSVRNCAASGSGLKT